MLLVNWADVVILVLFIYGLTESIANHGKERRRTEYRWYLPLVAYSIWLFLACNSYLLSRLFKL